MIWLRILILLAFEASCEAISTLDHSHSSLGAVMVDNTEDAFLILASTISERMMSMEGGGGVKRLDADHVERVSQSLRSMATAQATLKTFDGAAHEAYQRTHSTTSLGKDKVTGRTTRAAQRAGCTADALFACELCELLEYPELNRECEEGTLVGRTVLLNTTLELTGSPGTNLEGESVLSVLVIHDPEYSGGAGLRHGGINELVEDDRSIQDSSGKRGRLLIVLHDTLVNNLEETLRYLDTTPQPLTLQTGLINEAASVHGGIWKTARNLLETLIPILEEHGKATNTTNPAIHFVGRSLAGGVAGLSAAMLDGTIPTPNPRKHKKSKPITTNSTNVTQPLTRDHLSGFARGRVSAMCLGPCPCLSPNVRVAFVTSCIYGDDAIARATKASLDRLCSRANRHLKGNIFGKRVSWMADTVALTVSSLQSHVAGSEGEETKLSFPGKGYLVRPRRLGGLCSIHEVGGVSGREGIRAAVLWQLGDILLSKSLWRHHSLHSYIHGLDRVQLRNLSDSESEESSLH